MKKSFFRSLLTTLLVLTMLVLNVPFHVSAQTVAAAEPAPLSGSEPTAGPMLLAAGGEPTAAAVQGDYVTVYGENTFSLFNSGRTGSGSPGGTYTNPNVASRTNGGKDIYVTYDATVRIGPSFTVKHRVCSDATLMIKAYDVDEDSHYDPERDLVYLVDADTGDRKQVSGYLKGMNEQWNTTVLTIDKSFFEVGHTYYFQVYESVEGWHCWVRSVDLEVITIPVPSTRVTLNGFISEDGVVTATLDIWDLQEDTFFNVEYAAVSLADNNQYGSLLNQSMTAKAPSDSKTVTFRLESGAPKGAYRVDAIMTHGGSSTVSSFGAGYQYAAVNYDANGGSGDMPSDNKSYGEGDPVTVLFDKVPMRMGYDFLGWSRDKSASTPEFTDYGTKTFTIGESDVTLYAVWGEHAHTAGNWVTDYEPTCLLSGSEHVNCTECEALIATRPINALGHNYVLTDSKAATCTEDGYELYECDRSGCGAEKYLKLMAFGHDFGKDNICDTCGYNRDPHKHTFVKNVVEPTCSAVGYTDYSCSCGYTYRDDYIDQRGHRWDDGTVVVAKTCTTDGTIRYACKSCTVTYTEVLPGGHAWTERVALPATCTTEGVKIRVCDNCGEGTTTSIPAGHKWDAGTVITEPDCENEGVKRCTCEVCHETQDLPIPAKGHQFVDSVCKICGKSILEIVKPNEQHPEYGMYFEIDDIRSAYGPDLINEYGVLLDYNEGATITKVGVFLTQDGTMWRRCIACVGEGITYATYVPYLSYDEDIKYTGLNSAWINTFALKENYEGIWCYSNYATIGVNLEDYMGNLLLSLYDIGQAGAETRIFDDLDEMIRWLRPSCEHVYNDNYDNDCNTCGFVRYIIGDVNGDGTKDSDDAVQILYNMYYGASLYPLNQPADFTFDGNVNVDDAVKLLYNIFWGDGLYPLRDPDYVPTLYTVTFESNGGSAVDPITAEAGALLSVPADPTKTGYVFQGWYIDKACTEKYVFGTMPAENITLYAGWSGTPYYTVVFKFVDPDGNTLESVGYGAEYDVVRHVKPGVDAKTPRGVVGDIQRYADWVVIGWDSNGDGLPDEDYLTVNCDMTVVTVCRPKVSYTVRLLSSDGSVIDTLSRKEGATLEALADPVKTGHTFKGWYLDAACTDAFTSFGTFVIEADITLYAAWQKNAPTRLPTGEDPSMDDLDWDLEKVTHYYKVNFDPNGGVVSTANKTVAVNSFYGTLPVPTRTGYTFGGWYTAASGGMKVEETTQVSIAGNHTLYAHWTKSTYTVTFNANGGNVSTAKKTVAYDTTYGTLPTPTRTGYTFDGWYTAASGGTKITGQSIVAITGNHTLYAHWKQNTYTITYNTLHSINVNGASRACTGVVPSGSAKTYTVTSSFALPVATAELYPEQNVFLGWMDESGKLVTEKDLMLNPRNITLTAKWDLVTAIYTDMAKTPQIEGKGRFIVDWSSRGAGRFDFVDAIQTQTDRWNDNFDIYDASEVYFIGHEDAVYESVYFYLCNYATGGHPDGITMHFKDFNFTGFLKAWESSDDDIRVTLVCEGKNSIVSLDSYDAAVGSVYEVKDFGELTITGSGSLNIYGADGANATADGANGADGGVGIAVDTLTVDANTALSVYGGDGGDGKNGADNSSEKHGGNGGNGAVAILAESLRFINNANGQKTTAIGGNGGDGADGGNGRVGYVSNSGGYDGGHGGRGGHGGDGADAIRVAAVPTTLYSYISTVGGDGGSGGSGGDGGDGGVSHPALGWWTTVTGFNGGNAGAGGDGGDGGDGNVAGDGGAKGFAGTPGAKGDVKYGFGFNDIEASKAGNTADDGDPGDSGSTIS